MKRYKFVFVILLLFFIFLFLSTIFSLLNIANNKILNGIFINNMNVANLEPAVVYKSLYDFLNEKKSENIVVKYEDYESTISLEQLAVSYDIQSIVNDAYEIGRSKNIFFNNFEILFTSILKNKLYANISFDEIALNNVVEDISTKIPGKVKESSYYIEDDNLIISSGSSGFVVNSEKLKYDIISTIKSKIYGEDVSYIELSVSHVEPDIINIDSIYNDVFAEPKNAYIENNKIYPQVNGIDFAISMDDVKEILAESKAEYVIPLKITTPEVTIDDFGDKAFTDKLAKYTTRYDASNVNRANNILLASEKINGTIIMPGQIFSYNKIVGARTITAGYKEAPIYVNGKVVDGIGGGICQVSSTLYNSVLLANLEIVSRRNHYFMTSYVPASLDATVSYGSIDFQFKNTRNYPIKIVCSSDNGVCSIEIYGIKEDVEYDVVIESSVTETIPFMTKYKDNPNLPSGEEVLIVSGSNGYKSEAYKVLKLNGKVVSRTLLSKDSYNVRNAEIEKGTKK